MLLTMFELHADSVPWTARHLGDTKTIVQLGSIRIKQSRVRRNANCFLREWMTTDDSPNCYPPFSEAAESVKVFQKPWTPTSVGSAYTHHGANVTEMTPIVGEMATYPASGFIIDVSVNKTKALGQFTNLMEWDWVDDATRAIVIEINTLNPNMNVITSNNILFEFGPEGTVQSRIRVNSFNIKFLSMPLLQTDAPTDFIFFVLFLSAGIIFTLLIAYQFYMTGIIDFFTYIWNFADTLIVVFLWIVVASRVAVFDAVAAAPALAPDLVALTDIFMPYNVVIDGLETATDLSALLVLLVWLKVLKYIGLIPLWRTHVLVIEGCLKQICKFLPFLASIFVGFAVALNVGFGDRVPIYSSVWGCFVSLFFWLTGGTSLDPLFESGSTLGPGLYFMYLILIYFLLANLFMAIVLDVYTFTRFYGKLGDNFKRHHNAMSVFLYTYQNKLKGVALVGLEHEDNVGTPQEQFIDKDLLPMVVQQAIEKKLIAMGDLMEDAPEAMKGDEYQGSLASRSVGGTGVGGQRNTRPNEVSRIQLQRMMDEDEVFRTLLGADQAIKVIRAFKIDKPEDPYKQVTRLQATVFATMDQIEKAGYNLPLSHKESLQQVAHGLHESVNDIQNNWRNELNNVLFISHQISDELALLTRGIERCQLNHISVQQNLIADRGGV
jgi:hypothetical protein